MGRKVSVIYGLGKEKSNKKGKTSVLPFLGVDSKAVECL
tara:strand:- start:189 stop:305 length:117 start_codon:yes stop_codon:yes gene_type:complete